VLRQLLRDRSALVDQLAHEYREAELAPRERAMLDHAVQLTLAPKTIRSVDLERLREAGFSDQAILHITEVTAFFNWTNRVALGLGMEGWE
jgi:uncharacterized peroxidase-related enzyme